MSGSIKVSVLMSVYNECDEWLSAAVDSILNQTYANFEFIIINDNPKDERICRLLAEYAELDSRIRLVTNEHNMGLVASLNIGLQYVTGEYVARMDADDISHPDRLEKQLRFITEKEADLISSCRNIIDEDGKIIIKNRDGYYDYETTKKLMRYSNPLAHPLWFGKAALFKQLGGYRNVHSAEDYDFSIRAMEKGFRICVSGDVLLDYRKRISSISRKNALRQFIVSRFLAKNAGCLNTISPEEIEKYVSTRLNERDVKAYAKMTENKHPGKKASFMEKVLHTLYGLFISKYAFRYYYNAFMTRRIKEKSKKRRGVENADT